MEQYVKSQLQNGEHILWSGTPSNVKLLEAPYTVGIVIRWVVAAALFAFCIWYLTFFPTVGVSSTQAVVISVIIALIGVYLVVDPIHVVAKLKTQTFYCITNQRVIACYKARPMKMKFRTLDELDEISVELLSTGCGNLYFGRKTKRSAKMARVQFAMSELQEHDEKMPLVFYSVKDPEAVYNTLPAELSDIA